MNETLIKKIVKLKIDAASKIIECLPSKMSEEIITLGKIALAGINESLREKEMKTIKVVKHSNVLNNINVE